MSIWTRIADALTALRKGEPLSTVFDKLRTPPERTVAFTIAVIALGAKLAKADGQVTRGEVAAFRRIFTIPPEDEANAARVFNLARQDVAGFDLYARKIAGMFPPRDPVLVDLMEGLFEVAMADGSFHPQEEAFLSEVARIFGLTDRCFRCLRARFVGDVPPDPYDVLEVSHDAPIAVIQRAYRDAVRETHPDRLAARGVPQEAVKLAEHRLRDLNRAWEEIQQGRAA
ncbi:molecular chaperone DjiA [Roseinatronobacter bogoriensis]|uniref:Molecular chaperone DjiA n=1 Tax=Roseinatronobacter bogoriensis subsp. barguzinensis TaxID=441209 RepID=A0A2K8K9M3_9RHOB|nr:MULTISPECIES: molecular chaperone DjiA [Rhodobaca]ATX66149.1 molecular chaperone DjiA [Rhodobaca barguzinensis]MBB4207184.1 DnaJ like chaperone protein [Rhodobaca bogoriensis DSM 18756]TDW40446.1 DnaJ like chaperone protein [Rhodobaca barguzinensis]TDY70402.1 DnaJ like chaperone protein [Rhodobaca bogoriensis DSM 18756]